MLYLVCLLILFHQVFAFQRLSNDGTNRLGNGEQGQEQCQRKVIKSAKHKGIPGVLSPAIAVGNLVFVSGQIGRNPVSKQISPDIKLQVKQIFDNLQDILHASGSSLKNVIKMNVYLTDLDDYKALNDVFQYYFTTFPPPARSAVQVAGLVLNATVEIDAVAVMDKNENQVWK